MPPKTSFPCASGTRRLASTTAASGATREQCRERLEQEGDREQQDRDGRRGGGLAGFDLSEDVDRRHERLERNVARDRGQRSELRDRSREGLDHPGGDGGEDGRQQHLAER